MQDLFSNESGKSLLFVVPQGEGNTQRLTHLCGVPPPGHFNNLKV